MDEGIFGPIFVPDEFREAVSGRAWLQAMLDAEAALATAESHIGLIPHAAAAAIVSCCEATRFDAEELGRDGRAAGNPAPPLAKALTAAVSEVSEEAARCVHKGVTSQDIVGTAAMLVARRALDLVLAELEDPTHERGMEVRREVLGGDHVDASMERTTSFTTDLEDGKLRTTEYPLRGGSERRGVILGRTGRREPHMNHRHRSAPRLDVLIERLKLRLNERATAATREWWTKYLKGAASFRGVKMADVREVVHAWFEEERLGERLSAGQQKDLALLLLEEDFTEDKLAGVLFLQEILLPAGVLDWRSDVPRYARLFDRGHIHDWGTCDWFCVKVLGPLVERQGEGCARAISDWQEADSLWQRRASVVAFVDLAKRGDGNFVGFTEMVLDNCARLLRSRERFAQTGVGWVLRELSRSGEGRVVAFVEANLDRFSREALKNATKYLPPEVAEPLLQAHLPSGSRGRRRT